MGSRASSSPTTTGSRPPRRPCPALADLRDQGAVGAGTNQSAMLARFLRETAADVVMLAGRYPLLDRSALDDVLPAAREHGKSVVAVGVSTPDCSPETVPPRA